MLHFVGWDTAVQGAQAPGTFFTMRVTFAGGTVILALVAAWLISRYSVTPEAVAAAQHPPSGLEGGGGSCGNVAVDDAARSVTDAGRP